MTVRLEQLLAAATPGPWVARMAHVVGRHGLDVASTHAPDGNYERADTDAVLIAKTPDMARLLIDMGEALRLFIAFFDEKTIFDEKTMHTHSPSAMCQKAEALAARLDALGKDTA